jgi:hypothetical protein
MKGRSWQLWWRGVWVVALLSAWSSADAQLSGLKDGDLALPGAIEGTVYAPFGSEK